MLNGIAKKLRYKEEKTRATRRFDYPHTHRQVKLALIYIPSLLSDAATYVVGINEWALEMVRFWFNDNIYEVS